MYTIENEYLSATINEKGAELTSLVYKPSGQEYIWNADPTYWGKHSPVLFPIVGTLKDNTFIYNSKSYHLSRHGFARDKVFDVTAQTADSINLTLQDDSETLKIYPFQFQFSLIYTLEEKKLAVTYLVKNPNNGGMYFSVGGHPAFKVPLAEGLAYEDYYLRFSATENAGRWPISKDGLLEQIPVDLLSNTKRLPLSKKLFAQDALVFKSLASTEVALKSDKDEAGFTFNFEGFPYLGIWAAKDADFVCIEPWCGIADAVNASQKIEEKEGIIMLNKGAHFERTWSVEIQ